MDLREKKTKRSIKNAFIELRAKKALERISVKELAELAEISKATFYLHYQDIYDLSDHLQKEVIQNVLNSVNHPELILSDSIEFTKELFSAFHSQETLIDILFSGSQASILPISIEEELRRYIFNIIPEAKENEAFNVRLTYCIQGGFYSYQKFHKQYRMEFIIDTLKEMNTLASLL